MYLQHGTFVRLALGQICQLTNFPVLLHPSFSEPLSPPPSFSGRRSKLSRGPHRVLPGHPGTSCSTRVGSSFSSAHQSRSPGSPELPVE